MKLLTCACIVSVLLTALTAARADVQPGNAAPDFTLQDVAGVSRSLSAYRGNVVLLGLVGYN